MSCAWLIPMMTLAAQSGLSQLMADTIDIRKPRIKSGSANPAPKLTTIIAGMLLALSASMMLICCAPAA